MIIVVLFSGNPWQNLSWSVILYIVPPGTSWLVENGADADDIDNENCLEVDNGASVSPNHVIRPHSFAQSNPPKNGNVKPKKTHSISFQIMLDFFSLVFTTPCCSKSYFTCLPDYGVKIQPTHIFQPPYPWFWIPTTALSPTHHRSNLALSRSSPYEIFGSQTLHMLHCIKYRFCQYFLHFKTTCTEKVKDCQTIYR